MKVLKVNAGPRDSTTIDKRARILFPATFMLFAIVYFSICIVYGASTDTDGLKLVDCTTVE